MPSANVHALKTGILYAILYARVSTDEQVRHGYSIRQQLERGREWCAENGYEVLAEIVDAGQSGASLERPGMDEVRDRVAEGGVHLVWAQDRDRFSREPAYTYLLKREFEEYGTKMRSDNDRGDESPEGELTDGILDQLAKFERAKTAERSRRGKLQKARSGKVVGGHPVNYGFRMNAARDGYEVDEERMAIVRRIFRMVGVEGVSTHGVTKRFEAEGVPSPAGSKYWSKRIIKAFLLDDLYKPHTFEEIARLVSTEAASKLDPDKEYGVWWFNRRRTSRTPVSEMGPNGRVYRKKSRVIYRDKGEWIAVPVPDSGVPREWVEAARAVVTQYRSPSKAGGRFWELSGALMRCGECGRAMEAVDRYYRTKSGKKGVICYYRCREGNRRKETCGNRKSIRSDRAHPAVWELISGLLLDPERLREGLYYMIEEQRRVVCGGPRGEVKAWLDKLATLERKRSGCLDLAAEGIMDHSELRSKLAELREARETAERELEVIEKRRERLEQLERDRQALMEAYTGIMPEALHSLTPEERHQLYRMLRMRVVAYPDKTLEVNGSFDSRELGTFTPTQ